MEDAGNTGQRGELVRRGFRECSGEFRQEGGLADGREPNQSNAGVTSLMESEAASHKTKQRRRRA